MKEFWKEYGLSTLVWGGTGLLLLGKLAFGWGITWPWVFAPLWIPFVALLALIIIICGSVALLIGVVVGIVSLVERLDNKDFLDEAEALLDEADDAMKEAHDAVLAARRENDDSGTGGSVH